MVTRIIHQMIGPKINELIRGCLDSWNQLLDSGFEIKIWDDELITDFITCNYPNILDTFLNARNHAEAADIARYLIIYHFGGYYMDWDIELLDKKKFLDIAFRYSKGFLVLDSENDTLASECFSAVEGEEYLFKLVYEIQTIYTQGERDNLGTPQFSGPFRMRDVYKAHSSNQEIIPVNDIFVYNYSEIRNLPARKIEQPLIHYWVHSWLIN